MLAALVVAVLPPASYSAGAYYRLLGALEASAQLHASEIAELARVNPAIWEFDGLHVSAPDPAQPGLTAVAERRRVLDPAGRLVMEAEPDAGLPWPVLVHRAPVLVGGIIKGQAEAARSLRAVLLNSVWIAALSGCLGGVIFLVLRTVPLRLLRDALRRASHMASHDALTGLPNRAAFNDRLTHALAMARRDGKAVAVLCLDLDHFKQVNDTLGHAAGNRLLREVTARLCGCLRESDTLARLGGDEFAVIQLRSTGPAGAESLAQRLVAALAVPVDLGEHHATVGLSVGIVITEAGQATDASQLLRDADVALYRAKAEGRGRWRFFSPEMNLRLHQRRALEADLRLALAQDQLRLHYQPQVDLGSDAIVGAEALLRWERPGYGNVPPGDFIGLAEETGLIVAIGAWVLAKACMDATGWPGGVSVAVNVSPVQFSQPGLLNAVEAALSLSGLQAGRLQIEVTEGILLSDTDDTLAILNQLHAMGVKIAMDDFGTGYSSLGYLQRFPFDKLKIDQSFIRNLDTDPGAGAIIRAVIGMGLALGMRANAEGVETAAQANLLRAEGCEEVQGYHYGRPMPGRDFLTLLENAEEKRLPVLLQTLDQDVREAEVM